MRNPIRTAVRGTLAAAALAAALAPAQAALSCHKINAKGVGQDLGGGVTVARIVGGGLLHGSTQGSFAIVGGAPPVVAVAGTVTFTTAQATLVASLAGTFDVSTGSTGAFLTTGPVSAASGKLAGATGTLTLDGVQDLATGRFTETVSGVICVDLAP